MEIVVQVVVAAAVNDDVGAVAATAVTNIYYNCWAVTPVVVGRGLFLSLFVVVRMLQHK